MGIGYEAEIVLYNRTGGEIGSPAVYHATRLENVRIDLTKATSAGTTGSEAANTATFSVYDANLPKDYLEPEEWRARRDRELYFTLDENSYIIVSYSPALGVSGRALPGGAVSEAGFLEKLKQKGHVYHVSGAVHYGLIPHWEIEAA